MTVLYTQRQHSDCSLYLETTQWLFSIPRDSTVTVLYTQRQHSDCSLYPETAQWLFSIPRDNTVIVLYTQRQHSDCSLYPDRPVWSVMLVRGLKKNGSNSVNTLISQTAFMNNTDQVILFRLTAGHNRVSTHMQCRHHEHWTPAAALPTTQYFKVRHGQSRHHSGEFSDAWLDIKH